MRKYFDFPQPALIVAQSRSGSTFLCHCLDSHYQIGCERSEPFSPMHNWLKSGISPYNLAVMLWQRAGYQVTMFKISYRQMKNGYMAMEILREIRPKIINLHRQNVLDAIISATLCTASIAGEITHPIHTYEPVKQQEIELNRDTLLEDIDGYLYRVERMQELLSDFEVLNLTYEEICDSKSSMPLGTAHRLCDFLGVRRLPMHSGVTRLNPNPTITNLEQVRETLKGTDFEWMVR